MNKRVAFRAIIFQGFDFSIHYFSQLFLTEINLTLYMYISSDGNDLCMNEMVAPTVPKTMRDLWQKWYFVTKIVLTYCEKKLF